MADTALDRVKAMVPAQGHELQIVAVEDILHEDWQTCRDRVQEARRAALAEGYRGIQVVLDERHLNPSATGPYTQLDLCLPTTAFNHIDLVVLETQRYGVQHLRGRNVEAQS